MTEILLIRHAPTDWNATKRLQGLSDVPLSDHSRDWVKSWEIPERFHSFGWYSSPLSRAKETADSLCKTPPVITTNLLLEMDFGDWEGEVLPHLRERLGAVMKANEDRGLDFTPPNGESPRMVQQRLLPLLKTIQESRKNSVLVSHHGVMRAILALVYNWDMLGKSPLKFKQGYGYLFNINNDLSIDALETHIPFAPPEAVK